jgi:hypothetical protein
MNETVKRTFNLKQAKEPYTESYQSRWYRYLSAGKRITKSLKYLA